MASQGSGGWIKKLAACEGKSAFSSWALAEKNADRMRRRKKAKILPYRCSFCGCWHAGSPSRPESGKRSTLEELEEQDALCDGAGWGAEVFSGGV